MTEMTEPMATNVYTWAVYLGLFVSTSIVVSSMLFLLYYICRAAFFWRYNVVAQQMFTILKKVMEDNRGPTGNAELCFLSGVMMSIIHPKKFSRQSLDNLRDELHMTGSTEID